MKPYYLVGAGSLAKRLKHCSALLVCTCGTLAAQPPPQVAPLFSKELADLPGKEAVMLTVVYPPGAVEHAHRHDAHAFVYVLEGSLVMQLKGGPEVTLTPGQIFYEGPNDVHTLGRNASATQPAKFVVVLVKNQGAAPVLPVE